jgi:hypothetical protein
MPRAYGSAVIPGPVEQVWEAVYVDGFAALEKRFS